MTNTHKFIACVIVGLVAGWFLQSGGSMLSGVYSQVNNTFREGLKAGTSDQFYVESDGDVVTSGDATFRGGDVDVGASSGTTTITANLFCFEYAPTSTATMWRITPKLDGLTAATTTPLQATYGTCP